MRVSLQRLACLALAAGLAAAVPARAQDVPAGQSCGGLFCDLGIVGHKTAPAPPAAVPPPATVPATAVAAPGPAAGSPVEPAPRVRRHLAKAPVARHRVARVPEAPKVPVATARETPRLAARPVPPPAAPRVAAPVAAAPVTAATSPAVIVRAPRYQAPLIFQSIDPMLQ